METTETQFISKVTEWVVPGRYISIPIEAEVDRAIQVLQRDIVSSPIRVEFTVTVEMRVLDGGDE